MARVTGAAACIAGAAAYSLIEPYRYRVNRLQVPIPAQGLRILHVSDTHMTGKKKSLKRFLQAVPEMIPEPDVVLMTGDLVETNDGIDIVLEGLEPIRARLGRYYVFGSHDYYLSQFRLDSYLKYLNRARKPVPSRRVDTTRLVDGLERQGWTSLSNRVEKVTSGGIAVRLVGVDDPYLRRHKLSHVKREPGELVVGLMHSPDLVSEFALAGVDLILAGHTHAGQVRVPGVGALVTNCSLPPGLAGGLSRVGDAWLHVSPGLGTARFGPIRAFCRPEVTLLQLET